MPDGKPRSRLITAAGAVAWRPGPDGEPEILLVHRTRYDDWSLPKGKIEPGEQLPVTAVREVLEEGGARLALGRRLISIRYHVGGRPKRVHYWAARVVSLDDRAVPNAEVDQIKWVGAAHAVEHVSYAHDHGVLADFARLPAQTVPVILLRHAKAMHKASWSRADSRRPLDDSGRADAKALAELLTCFAPRARLITSPAVRCVETLRPFAELSGATMREEPSLYVHHLLAATDQDDSARLSVAALVSEAIAAGEPTIICAHRENLPDLQAAALAALGIAAPGSDAGPRQRTGGRCACPHRRAPQGLGRRPPHPGFWVLNLAHAPSPGSGPSPIILSAPPAPSAPAPAPSFPPSPGPPFPPDPSTLLAAPTSAVSPPPPADLPPPAHAPSRVPLPPPAPARRRWFAFRRPSRNVVPATEAPAASAPPVPETTVPETTVPSHQPRPPSQSHRTTASGRSPAHLRRPLRPHRALTLLIPTSRHPTHPAPVAYANDRSDPAAEAPLYGFRTDKLGQNRSATRQYPYKDDRSDQWDSASTALAGTRRSRGSSRTCHLRQRPSSNLSPTQRPPLLVSLA